MEEEGNGGDARAIEGIRSVSTGTQRACGYASEAVDLWQFAIRKNSRQTEIHMDVCDIICIGAGPTGLATAIEAKRAGMRSLVIDKASLCNSIFHYPVNMVFFTTPELLEIGDLPLTSPNEKPTRVEALKYYRRAAEHYELELRLFELVVRVDGTDGNFTVHTTAESGTACKYQSRKIVVATGYYDLPNKINVPGEDLPNVSHYYTESTPF